jgi:hypothetical protein
LASAHLNVELGEQKTPKPQIALAGAHLDFEFHRHVVREMHIPVGSDPSGYLCLTAKW